MANQSQIFFADLGRLGLFLNDYIGY